MLEILRVEGGGQTTVPYWKYALSQSLPHNLQVVILSILL